MKTFADLTDEQFTQLHHLAWNIQDEPMKVKVSHYLSNISVWQTRDGNGNMTEFNGVTGEIVCLMMRSSPPSVLFSRNIWQIVALCKEWDLVYVSVDPHVY